MHINQYLLHFDFKNFIIEKKNLVSRNFQKSKKTNKICGNQENW